MARASSERMREPENVPPEKLNPQEFDRETGDPLSNRGAVADMHESANQAGEPKLPDRQVGDPNSHFCERAPLKWPRYGMWDRRLSAVGRVANGLVPPAAHAGEPEPVHFGRDILPIFSENCFPCHGPDVEARKADLRLDRKESALRETEAVIVPGKSGESELIKRVASKDASEVMPPPNSAKKLTAP